MIGVNPGGVVQASTNHSRPDLLCNLRAELYLFHLIHLLTTARFMYPIIKIKISKYNKITLENVR